MPEVDVKSLNFSLRDAPVFYLSTLQSPTASFNSCYANFTGKDEHNLVVNKGTKLEIFDIVKGGLLPRLEVPIMGRISVMKSFRPTTFETDLLALLTEKGDFFVLSFKANAVPSKGEIVTLVHASVNSLDCMPTRTAQLVSIDIATQMIAIHVSIGVIQLIRFDVLGSEEVQFKKAFPLKVMELEIFDMAFIDGIKVLTSPTLSILHRMPMKLPQLKTYDVASPTNSVSSLSPTIYSMSDLSTDTNFIIRVPKPRHGFLLIAPERIVYSNPLGNILRKIVFSSTYFTCCAPVDGDGFRYLLGSSSGELYILLLMEGKRGIVNELKFERLGRTSIPSCLTYIDDGYVYVGSQHGDSQLVQLSSERVSTAAFGLEAQFVRIIENYPSLAPLTDFCISRPNPLSDQVTLVACSGSAKDGALKIISSGVEVSTMMTAELEESEHASLALFQCRASASSDNSSYLVVSSLGRTVAYRVDPVAGCFEEVCFGINSNLETLDLLQMGPSHLAQVTSAGIFLGSTKNDTFGGMWNCKPNERVLLAAHHGNRFLLAMNDRSVRLFDITPSGFTVLASETFPAEVSCLTIFRASETRAESETSNASASSQVIGLIGFWELGLFGYLLHSPESKKLTFKAITAPSGFSAITRSVKVIENLAEGSVFGVFGSGDGQLLICPVISAAALETEDETKVDLVRIGQAPVALVAFGDRGHLLAQSERPHHLTWHRNRLICSSILNLPPFSACAPFTFSEQAGFVAICGREARFCLLHASPIPKLNIFNVPVGKSIYRLVHLKRYGLFAAILHTFPIMTVPMSHWAHLKSELVLFHDRSFSIVDRYELQNSNRSNGVVEAASEKFAEIGWSLAVGALKGLEDPFGETLVLGTSLYHCDDSRMDQGRILVFQIGEGPRLRLLSTNETAGGVRVVSICQGFLVACVRGLNVVYRWDYQAEKKLIKSSSSGGHIDGTCMASIDNILAIGDSLTSVSFCHFNTSATTTTAAETDTGASSLKITEFARDFQDNYISALQMIDHGSVVASDLTGNLLTLQVIRDESLDLNVAACEGNIHLGDQINAIIPGDFRSHPDVALKSFLMVSSAGAIYALHQIPMEIYRKLSILQKNLQTMLKPVGGIKASEFRRFFNGDRTLKASAGFIDGDLMTQFLALTAAGKSEALGTSGKSSVAAASNLKSDEAIKMIESLSFGI